MKNEIKRRKNIVRDSLTGKIVNGREVVLLENAELYLKKLGYKIIKPQLIYAVKTLTIIFLILGSFLMFPFVSAQNEIFSLNFEEKGQQLVLIFSFLMAGFLFYKKQFVLSSIILLILGFTFLFNGVNAILSMLIVLIGVWTGFNYQE